MTKYIAAALVGFAGLGFASLAQAQTAAPVPGMRPNINAQAAPTGKGKEIQACLQKHLGTPGQGPMPSKEKIQEAFNACNVKMPPTGAVRDSGAAPVTPAAPAKTH